jgi:hypothetical protein
MSKNGPIFQAGLHKIKWKPMDTKRRAAQEPDVVIQWFKGYAELRKIHKIEAENTWNFGETGVWNACPRSIWVWVPTEIEEASFLYFYFQK